MRLTSCHHNELDRVLVPCDVQIAKRDLGKIPDRIEVANKPKAA